MILPFSAGEDITSSVKVYLGESRKILSNLMDKSYPALRLVKIYAYMMDSLIAGLFNHAIKKSDYPESLPVSVLAQGGYGRLEMNWHSDVDILFLFDKKP